MPLITDATNASPNECPLLPDLNARYYDFGSRRSWWSEPKDGMKTRYESNGGTVKTKGRHGGMVSRVINPWTAAIPSSGSPTTFIHRSNKETGNPVTRQSQISAKNLKNYQPRRLAWTDLRGGHNLDRKKSQRGQVKGTKRSPTNSAPWHSGKGQPSRFSTSAARVDPEGVESASASDSTSACTRAASRLT